MTTSFTILRNDSLMSTRQTEKPWLWKGFLAAGEITLFTAMWKSGKSTLISVLLAKMKQGGELAGQPVSRAKVLVVSEESPEKWAERGHKLGFSDHLFWICRPFKGRPTLEDWNALLQQIMELQEKEKIDLVVIDSLSNLAPLRSENDAGEMLKAISPLQELTKRGLAILITHHPRKGALIPGQAARGSGALCGFVDCIIEMYRTSSHHARDRRRRLSAYSRHDETPSTIVIELNTEGNEYLMLGEKGELGFERAWPIVKDILEHAETWGYMSVLDIRRKWPAGFAPPAQRTVQDWMKKAWENEMVEHTGEGHKKDPYRYCLSGMPAIWQDRFKAEFFERLDRREKTPEKIEADSPKPLVDSGATPANGFATADESTTEPSDEFENLPETTPTEMTEPNEQPAREPDDILTTEVDFSPGAEDTPEPASEVADFASLWDPTPEPQPDTTNEPDPTPPSKEELATPPSSGQVDNPSPKPNEPAVAPPEQKSAVPPAPPAPKWPTYNGPDPITALAVSQQRYAAALAQRCAEMQKKSHKGG
jgi:hypothetical protein